MNIMVVNRTIKQSTAFNAKVAITFVTNPSHPVYPNRGLCVADVCSACKLYSNLSQGVTITKDEMIGVYSGYYEIDTPSSDSKCIRLCLFNCNS